MSALAADRPVVVVGIDGRSGVGKSTVAAALCALVGAVRVDGDAFFAGGTGLRPEPPAARAGMCIDRPKLARVLRDLRDGGAVRYRPFDWEAFDGSLAADPIAIPPAPVYVLDGTYSCHPDYGALVDLRVLAHASGATRMARLIAREGAIGAWERQWHEAEAWYFAEAMRPERFDHVLDLDPPGPGALNADPATPPE